MFQKLPLARALAVVIAASLVATPLGLVKFASAVEPDALEDPGGTLEELLNAAGDASSGAQPVGTDGSPVPSDSSLFLVSYQVPDSFRSIQRGSQAGEPSVTVSWKTDHVFLKEDGPIARGVFDDGAFPPAVQWTQVADPVTVQGGGVADPRMTGDHQTGRIWTLDEAGPTAEFLFSDDEGATWLPAQPPNSAPGIDHQSMGVGNFPPNLAPANATYPHMLAYCAQSGLTAGLEACDRSVDGGLTWLGPLPMDLLQCQALFGKVAIGPDGTIYVPHGRCVDSGQATAPDLFVGTLRTGFLASHDGGATWSRSLAPGSGASRTDPGLGVDAANNVYLGWSNGCGAVPCMTGPIRAAVMHPDGTWSPTTDLGAPFSIRNSVFPQAVGGDAGRAAIAFLGTTTAGDTQDASFPGEWHLYVSYTFDTGQHWTTVDATPVDPVQRGCIWLQGGSNPCRNLLDFNDIDIDSTGRVVVSYDDGCTTFGCVARGGTNLMSTDSRGTLARQVGGPRLLAKSDPAPAEPLLAQARGATTTVGVSTFVDGAAMGGTPPYTYIWDLNDDGVFGDAEGRTVAFTNVATPGYRVVSVRATDAAGLTATATTGVKVLGDAFTGHAAKGWSFETAGACDAQGWTDLPGRSNGAPPNGARDAGSRWHLTTDQPGSAPCAFYDGEDALKQYLPGTDWNLISPCLSLPKGAAGLGVAFDLAGASQAALDILVVQWRQGCVPATESVLNNNTVYLGDTSLYNTAVGGTFSGTIGDLANGVYVNERVALNDLAQLTPATFQLRLRFSADDTTQASGFQVDNVQLWTLDGAPTLTGLSDRSVDDLHTMAFTVGATDPEQDAVTLSAEGLPAGASFDAATGAFSWQPSFAQAPGSFDVTFRATDGLNTVARTVTLTALNVAPVAAGSAGSTTATRIAPVPFTDASSDPDGTVVSWLWDFGDGSTSTAQSPSHTYATLGAKQVTLTVTDNDGASTTGDVATIVVKNVKPNAKASMPAEANRVDAASFRDASSDPDGTIAARSWSFGDGGTSTDAQPTHTFGTLGAKTVTLTVTDDDGESSSVSQVVDVVNLLPSADFTTTPAHPTALLPVLFNGTGSDRDGTIASWAWSFGDGEHSTDQNPVKVYTQGGLYTVTLSVTDNDGGVRTITRDVFVCSPGVDASTLLNLQHIHVDVQACLDLSVPLP